MTRTAGAPIGCQRPSRFWGLGCPKIYHEVEDTLVFHIIVEMMGIVLTEFLWRNIHYTMRGRNAERC
ncbi:hypothetical protein [Thiolapillus sp.]|uniref:hypothetical protein n=1 Tax=Thiolapillus sp. TaxID=2017437 RepID=UPI0025CFF4A5|nr:hypothetical protein [Thiolapillus sp.]